MVWKDSFKKGKELVLCTCSGNNPHANIAVSLGFMDDKLIIADCQMVTTVRNLKNNKNICVVSDYCRIKGNAQVYSSGKYFDFCVKNTKDYAVKNAVVVSIKEVFDLDKGKKVF